VIERERERDGTPSPRARNARNAMIVRWHGELGEGSLSSIARAAGVSRVQAGRIVRAARDTVPGQPPPPTRRYYQSKRSRPVPVPAAETITTD
jgi:hypothetical protein